MADGRNIDALLQRSEELTANLYGGDELPRVKRNLTQVLDAGKRLWSKTAAHGTEAHQVKAALLLAVLLNPPWISCVPGSNGIRLKS